MTQYIYDSVKIAFGQDTGLISSKVSVPTCSFPFSPYLYVSDAYLFPN